MKHSPALVKYSFSGKQLAVQIAVAKRLLVPTHINLLSRSEAWQLIHLQREGGAWDVYRRHLTNYSGDHIWRCTHQTLGVNVHPASEQDGVEGGGVGWEAWFGFTRYFIRKG